MSRSTLEQVQSLASAGQTDEARRLALGRATKEISDPALHLAWSEVLGDLELYDEALMELNLAARDAPGDIEIKKRLAEAYQDNGRVKQAAACWREAVRLDPGNPDHYEALGRLLEETGNLEAAAKVYTAGLTQTGHPVFKALLKELRPSEPEPEEKPAEELHPTDTDLVRFCHLFDGREGVYARQWVGSSGKSGYTPVRDPFTPAVARNHILGNFTIGIYPLRMDNTVRFMAFDLDVPSFEVAQNIGRRRDWESLLRRAHQAALRIVEAASGLGLEFYIEDSGFKGRHCWLFFSEPVPGAAARRFGQALLENLDLTAAGVSVELFPKQAVIRGDGLGNLIKLPLGIHRLSGKRGVFVDPEGNPYPDQLAVLRRLKQVEKERFFEVVRRHPPQKPVKLAPAGVKDREEAEADQTVRRTVGPAVVTEYDPERDAELQYLLLKCEVLRHIVEGINRDGQIGSEETVVLAHTVGHLKNGPEAFNALLKRAVNADPALFLKSRLKGNPISCPKIRKRLPHITARVSCDCAFDPSLNLYPSPVRHVEAMSVEGAGPGLTADSMQFEQVLREYMKLKRQMVEINTLIGKYEKRLAAVFEESGAEEIQTSQGRLRLVKDQDGRIGFALTM